MIAALLLSLAGIGSQITDTQTSLRFGRFGTVAVYHPAAPPTSVALFFSGDGGWNEGVVDMARALADDGALVLGVSTPHYLRQVDASLDRCAYFAGDVESLSQFAQKALGLPRYQPPILVGYSSGAGLVYAALAQAPDNTFQGALSLGFDALLPTKTSACVRNGLTSRAGPKGKGRLVAPVGHLPAPWIVLHGARDVVSPIDSVANFVKTVSGGELIPLPTVGHGFSKQDQWLPQFRASVLRLAPKAPPPTAGGELPLGDLPVIELPPPPAPADYFAIVLSGDGGWASIDKAIGEELVKAGVPTVGFNSLQYFWTKRSPEESAADLERIIRHYQAALGREKLVIVGYSRGADVLPLMVSRLPTALLAQIRLIAFIGLQPQTDLEFRIGDWLGPRQQATYRVLPEVEKLQGHPMLCIYGAKEDDSLCPNLPPGLADLAKLPGGHHFDGDYQGLATLILHHVR
ncbi:MAG TPA: AcvB/VirJ family lysyl-phosphatidylglycerol hydrolase [Gemmatimonadales bacterium]|nr:AcvB/VirJ family lysyl-phosphatidylglycerol hydrolase [Gemmatimonadales bacterium]